MIAKNDSLVERVWRAGVVGAGGAGFPTWKKIDARAEIVIVNGAECEPLLRNDQQLMASRAAEILRGLKLVMKAVGAKEGVVALKEKYRAAIGELSRLIKPADGVRLHPLKGVYPAGDEFVLVYEVCRRVVPAGKIPLAVGVLVSNPETFLNIARAEKGEAVTGRFLTVTGAVKRPKTLRLPIGTPLKRAVELAGGATVEDPALVVGGPMMGEVASHDGEPVTKTTSSIIVLPRDHKVVVRKQQALDFDLRKTMEICCQCVYCTLICPRSLLGHEFKPHLVMRSLALGLPYPRSPGLSSAAACCACDLCGVYSCPMELPIGRLNKKIAGELEDWNWKRTPQPERPRPAPLREYSLVPVSRLTSRLELKDYDLPAPTDDHDHTVDRVFIPLKQHIGRPAGAVVKRNQKVKQGDLIGGMEPGEMGARVHASISGTVREVTAEMVVIEAG